MSTPSPLHQRLSKRLRRELEEYFETRGVAKVFNAPIDVLLAQHDVVLPEFVIVAVPSEIAHGTIEGVPLLVAEVISPESRAQDQSIKVRRYSDLGIPHSWVVDPDARTIECRRLERGAYRVVAEPTVPETLRHPDWPDLSIDLAALWS
jgi:Uma2 family endonuclease